MATTWTKVNKAAGTTWNKVLKPSGGTKTVSTVGSPIGLLMALTYSTTTTVTTNIWTPVSKAAGTVWTKVTKAT